MCSGAEQSPINFQVDLCTVQTAAVPLQYFNSGRRPRNVTIENNGYSSNSINLANNWRLAVYFPVHSRCSWVPLPFRANSRFIRWPIGRGVRLWIYPFPLGRERQRRIWTPFEWEEIRGGDARRSSQCKVQGLKGGCSVQRWDCRSWILVSGEGGREFQLCFTWNIKLVHSFVGLGIRARQPCVCSNRTVDCGE